MYNLLFVCLQLLHSSISVLEAVWLLVSLAPFLPQKFLKIIFWSNFEEWGTY